MGAANKVRVVVVVVGSVVVGLLVVVVGLVVAVVGLVVAVVACFVVDPILLRVLVLVVLVFDHFHFLLRIPQFHLLLV